jgi:prevent-host-death family protein
MQILTKNISSISELKANPMKVLESAGGEAIAILNHNKPAFYCVPVDAYDNMQNGNSTLPNYTNTEIQQEIADRIKECGNHPENLLTVEELDRDIREKLLQKL